MKKIISATIAIFSVVMMFAQTTISGLVTDANSSFPIPGVNIKVKNAESGSSTDFDGKFSLSTTATLPLILEISYVGYSEATYKIVENDQYIVVQLKENTTSLDEVVISASRTPERIFESPVTVERFALKEIKNTASADFYDGLENLKGVDINVNSLTFKSINTRGFATFANERFVQLVDGMDNSAPALNFPLGNLLGMIETDVLSVELLPGASSALYGANAFNGILFMTSKNPFDHPGISGYLKPGITSQEAAGTNFYVDIGVRAAFKLSDKFAFKINMGYLKGTDWYAVDEADKNNAGKTRTALDYNGVNVYGDEVATNIRAASGGLGIIPNVVVSRTGYLESDLTDYNAESIKADAGIYFRPWANDFEIAFIAKYGSGNSIFQGTNRYNIANFNLQQYKLEISDDDFMVRLYTNKDDAGDSYDMTFTGININRVWKPDELWFGQYIQAYAGATLGGATNDEAHAAGRSVAETGRLVPGTQEFQDAFDKVISNPDLTEGSKFQDESQTYNAEAFYNFSHLVKFADIIAGGSYRQYKLNSFGSIYTDGDGPIKYSEIGFYAQLQKAFLEDERLKLTASLRFDKSELFDGFLSPRISLGYTLGENGNHNVRASYQTGFRNPTTQDLFIGLDAGLAVLVGSAEENLDRDIREYGVSQSGQDLGQPASVSIVGRAAYENSFSESSVDNFDESGNVNDLQMGNPDIVKPEQVSSFEVGYRGKINKITIDFSTYYSKYKDFISNENVYIPFYGTVGNDLSIDALRNRDRKKYQTYTNSDVDINSYGAAIAASIKVFGNYDLLANYTFSKLDYDAEKNPDFTTNFNTPEHKVKVSFGNVNLFENFGFNVAWRWSDTYLWEAAFGDGIIPAYQTVDAQVNYRIPKLLSTIKLGATNILGDEYFTAFGTGHIGSQYYLSITINNL